MAQTEIDSIEVAEAPDVSHLITEDDTPVDSLYAARQQELLIDPLYADWEPGEPLLAVANVGLFAKPENPALVPDVMFSLDVTVPEDFWKKDNRSYFVWKYGKPPDVVVEIVSDREGGELDRKLRDYARMHVPYYVVYDPQLLLQSNPVAVYEFGGRRYRLRPDLQLPDLGLSLGIWQGSFRQVDSDWLRWSFPTGSLLRTSEERAEHERERAEQEREHAEHERERAEHERERADRLAAKLKELGIDPES